MGVNAGVANAGTTVNWLQGNHLTCDLTAGTVGNVQVLLLDWDRTGGTITEDFAYLAIVEDAGLHTVGGTAYAIDSKTTLPSVFSGSISTPLLLNESESVLASGYAYGIKSKVTNKQTSGAPNIIASRAEAAADTTVSSGSVYGTNSKAMSTGTGDADFLIGTYSTAENMNEGSVTSGMYGAWSQSRSRGAAVVNINAMFGSVNKVMTDNASSTIIDMVGVYAEADITAGNVTNEVNVIETRVNGTGAIIGGDLSMIKINNSSAPASITGTARAIWSASTFPSLFAGEIKTTSDLRVTGSIYDSTDVNGTNGQVLTSTGSGTEWTSLDSAPGTVITVNNLVFSSQMKNLIANPKLLIAAPTEFDRAIKILSATIRFNGTATAFDYTDALRIQYTDGTEILQLGTTSANSTSDKTFNIGSPAAISTSQEIPLFTGVEFTTTNNDATVGSAQVAISVSYVIHDLNINI